MNCDDILAVLVDFLNGELVIERREVVEIHIRGCPHCEAYVATYTHTVTVARALPKCGQLSPEFEARLRAALAQHINNE